MLSERWRRMVGWGWLIPLALALPAPAFALQTHADEGVYLHQLAHLFFLAAMIFFALRIQGSRFAARRPWHLMAAGAWLLALWNIWAFGGHLVEMLVPEASLVHESGRLVPRIILASWLEVVYFIARMDHLVAVPAVFCFYFGMRGLFLEADPGEGRPAGGSE